MGTDPAQSMGVEDSFNGVRAVRAAGMYTVMVPDMIAPTDEILGLCDACPKTLTDIITIIENMKGSKNHD
jgi:beta-phosphoglucomutase-like phosphatase (HAD superfamily)